jgi:hypothetical protein
VPFIKAAGGAGIEGGRGLPLPNRRDGAMKSWRQDFEPDGKGGDGSERVWREQAEKRRGMGPAALGDDMATNDVKRFGDRLDDDQACQRRSGVERYVTMG